jgi:hypothetical protein
MKLSKARKQLLQAQSFNYLKKKGITPDINGIYTIGDKHYKLVLGILSRIS